MKRNKLLSELKNLKPGYNFVKNLNDKFKTQFNIKALINSRYSIVVKTANYKLDLSKYKFEKDIEGNWKILTMSRLHTVGAILAVEKLLKKYEKLKKRKNKNKIIDKINKLVAEIREKDAKK
jgi:hypothetical protein